MWIEGGFRWRMLSASGQVGHWLSTLRKWRPAIRPEMINTLDSKPCVRRFAAHRYQSSSTAAELVQTVAATSVEIVRIDWLNEEQRRAIVMAKICEAPGLTCASVGEEVSMCYREADSSDSGVGVNGLNIFRVRYIQTFMWVENREQWSSRIESDDCVYSSIANGFSGVTSDVSCSRYNFEVRKCVLQKF